MFDVEYGGIYVSPAQYNNQLIHKKVVIWWFDHWRHYIYGNGPVIFSVSILKHQYSSWILTNAPL